MTTTESRPSRAMSAEARCANPKCERIVIEPRKLCEEHYRAAWIATEGEAY